MGEMDKIKPEGGGDGGEQLEGTGAGPITSVLLSSLPAPYGSASEFSL